MPWTCPREEVSTGGSSLGGGYGVVEAAGQNGLGVSGLQRCGEEGGTGKGSRCYGLVSD
jgi:hypothetical protein